MARGGGRRHRRVGVGADESDIMAGGSMKGTRVRRVMTVGRKGPRFNSLVDGRPPVDGVNMDWDAAMRAWERQVVVRLQASAREIMAEAERVVFDLQRGAMHPNELQRWDNLKAMASDIEAALIVLRCPPTEADMREMVGQRNWRLSDRKRARSLPPADYPSRWDRLPDQARSLSQWSSRMQRGYRA